MVGMLEIENASLQDVQTLVHLYTYLVMFFALYDERTEERIKSNDYIFTNNFTVNTNLSGEKPADYQPDLAYKRLTEKKQKRHLCL